MEIWKDIKGYEGLYQVSNLGRVKSLERFIIQKSRCGSEIPRKYKGKILNLKETNGGYLMTHLWKQDKGKFYLVHRLVYETFNGEIPDGLQVNHINENIKDNRLENLNLLSCKDNNNYGTRNKRVSEALKGRKRPSEIFEKLRRPIEAIDTTSGEIVYRFISISEAERSGFSRTAIKTCCRNKYWNKQGNNIYKGLIWRYA